MVRQLIVEGPDCSGKSSVVDLIKNVLRWDAKSLHHKEGNQFRRYLKEYAGNEEVVFNRSHFSEEAYSKLWRGGNPFSKEEKIILNKISMEDTIIIFACPSLKTLQQRYLKRNFPQQIKFEELKIIRAYFIEIMKDIPHILYLSKNYQELDELIEKIKNDINRK